MTHAKVTVDNGKSRAPIGIDFRHVSISLNENAAENLIAELQAALDNLKHMKEKL